MTTPERHQEISDRFLADAEFEFERGDLLQASEKAWGAVVHYLKSVAQQQGWEHGSHYHIRQNASRLLRLVDDHNTNRDKLSLIERLHINFYEENFPEEEIRHGMNNARALIAAFKEAEPRL